MSLLTFRLTDFPGGQILCDLHMPNKDGYQTCKDIRRKEKDDGVPHLPIIALSANVLGDVYQKCAEAGFNGKLFSSTDYEKNVVLPCSTNALSSGYMTKPVDFKELSGVLMTFMDPADPHKPHEFMKVKHRKGAAGYAQSRNVK